MQVKIFITKKELTQVAQQAQLINNGEVADEAILSLTIDDNRIAVDVPNMARSLQREIVVDRIEREELEDRRREMAEAE